MKSLKAMSLMIVLLACACGKEERVNTRQAVAPVDELLNDELPNDQDLNPAEPVVDEKPAPAMNPLIALTLSGGALRMPKGTISAWTVTGIYEDETEANLTKHVDWSIEDGLILEVSNAATGTIKAKDIGLSEVTASLNGIEATVQIEVYAPIMVSLKITGTTYNATAGGAPIALKAEAVYSDNSTADLTETVEWSSVTPAIATVSNVAGSKGRVQGIAAGNVDIVATDTSSGAMATKQITVVP